MLLVEVEISDFLVEDPCTGTRSSSTPVAARNFQGRTYAGYGQKDLLPTMEEDVASTMILPEHHPSFFFEHGSLEQHNLSV